MKVTVTKYLNVRVGEPSLNAPSYQYLAPGSIIDVDDELHKGDTYDGIDTWLRDQSNNFYWRGGTNFSPDAGGLLENSTLPGDKKTFEWFNKLGFTKIWTDHQEKGERVTVAVLDTGCNPSIRDVATAVTKDKICITSKLYPGIELVSGDQSNEGHGTRCLSIIGSRNTAEYVVGIAPACNLLSAKVSIAREIRDFGTILDGIEWAINEGAEVISVSYAMELTANQVTTYNQRFQNLIRGKNILIFAACGNSGNQSIIAERYPASFDGCISIGATNNNSLDPINIQSNRTILHAQGIDVEAYGKALVPSPGSGTSYSTPIIAGTAALAISFLKRDKGWSRDDLLARIIRTADPISGSTTKKVINPVSLFNDLNQTIV